MSYSCVFDRGLCSQNMNIQNVCMCVIEKHGETEAKETARGATPGLTHSGQVPQQ